MNRSGWKNGERKIATLLGGQRVPVSGRARGDAPDVTSPWLSVEVKCRKALPSWLHTAMSQARAAAKPDQLPIVVLHEDGRQYRDAHVVVRLADFVEWFGDAP
jgi:hypothetical protein